MRRIDEVTDESVNHGLKSDKVAPLQQCISGFNR